MGADGGSWRRKSGGRDNGGIVLWRRWHGSARLGAAPRANSGHCLAPLGLSAAAALCPGSLWVRAVHRAGWGGPVPGARVAVPGCAAIARWEGAARGGSQLLAPDPCGMVGPAREAGWYVWLQKKMGTGGNGDHGVASADVLPTLAPGARCGAVGRPMRAGPSCFARAMQSISSSGGWTPPVLPR